MLPAALSGAPAHPEGCRKYATGCSSEPCGTMPAPSVLISLSLHSFQQALRV